MSRHKWQDERWMLALMPPSAPYNAQAYSRRRCTKCGIVELVGYRRRHGGKSGQVKFWVRPPDRQEHRTALPQCVTVAP